MKKRVDMNKITLQEDKSLATARILNFFKDNKSKNFSNTSIAEALNLSVGTVSSITTRLSSLGVLVASAFRKNKATFSPLFQYHEKAKIAVDIEKEKEDAAVLAKIFLDSNKSNSYTREEIMDYIERPLSSVRSALHSLLVTGSIKVVKLQPIVKYQSSKSRKRGFEISFETSYPEHITVAEYVKVNQLDEKSEKVLRREVSSKNFILVYSSLGVKPMYLKEDLDSIIKNKCKQKKNVWDSFFFRIDSEGNKI